MFRYAFFKQAAVAMNLVFATSSAPVHLSSPPQAPNTAVVQRAARPVARPSQRLISETPRRDSAADNDGPSGECRCVMSYDGGLTEDQIKAMH
jgi:hypothetical protein